MRALVTPGPVYESPFGRSPPWRYLASFLQFPAFNCWTFRLPWYTCHHQLAGLTRGADPLWTLDEPTKSMDDGAVGQYQICATIQRGLGMSLTVRAIEFVSPATYELVLQGDGYDRRVRCKVVEAGGIRAIQPEPDVFMAGELLTRAICAAVLAFHDAVSLDGADRAGTY